MRKKFLYLSENIKQGQSQRDSLKKYFLKTKVSDFLPRNFLSKKPSLVALIFMAFIPLISPPFVFAQTNFSGVSSLGMAGTGRAAIESNEVGFLNPASLTQIKGYNFAVAYRRLTANKNNQIADITDEMAHISDSKTGSMFPLAVTYLKTKMSNFYGNATRKDLHLTTADFISKDLSFGIDIARYSFSASTFKKGSQWNFSPGLLWTPKPFLGMGVIYRNIIKNKSPFMYKALEAGVNYIFEAPLRFTLDIAYPTEKNKDHKTIIMAGLEHLYMGQVPIRAGYRFDRFTQVDFWTLGLGWKGPKIGLDYAFEKGTKTEGGYAHSIDLKIYF